MIPLLFPLPSPLPFLEISHAVGSIFVALKTNIPIKLHGIRFVVCVEVCVFPHYYSKVTEQSGFSRAVSRNVAQELSCVWFLFFLTCSHLTPLRFFHSLRREHLLAFSPFFPCRSCVSVCVCARIRTI